MKKGKTEIFLCLKKTVASLTALLLQFLWTVGHPENRYGKMVYDAMITNTSAFLNLQLCIFTACKHLKCVPKRVWSSLNYCNEKELNQRQIHVTKASSISYCFKYCTKAKYSYNFRVFFRHFTGKW